MGLSKKLRRLKITNEPVRKFYSKKRSIERHLLLQSYAKRLSANLPRSEKWFHELFSVEQFRNTYIDHQYYHDLINEPLWDTYIPDVMNKGYKYIIEIDGSIHDLPKQKLRDADKDEYYHSKGFLVLRIRHNNMEDYAKAVEAIKGRVETFNKMERHLSYDRTIRRTRAKKSRDRRTRLDTDKLLEFKNRPYKENEFSKGDRKAINKWHRNPKAYEWVKHFYGDSTQNLNRKKGDIYGDHFGKYCPVVLNKYYKYAIDIEDVPPSDLRALEMFNFKREQEASYYRHRGYHLFKIRAFDERELQMTIDSIKNIVQKGRNK